MVDDRDWDEVQKILEVDLNTDDPEVEKLYSDVERYADRAEVLEDHGTNADANYYKELAVNSYNSLTTVLQFKGRMDNWESEW